MKLYLESDFHNWYDHAFDSRYDSEAEPFRRVSTDGMNRKEMFEFLDYSLWLHIPINGTVQEVFEQRFGKSAKFFENHIVLYHDITSHSGENKELIRANQALKQYPDTFCSVYIKHKDWEEHSFGISYRYLKIGKNHYWLKYTSYDDWRSNNGNVKIELLDNIERFDNVLYIPSYVPFFAIDFIADKYEDFYAIDYNIAPGLKWTGIEQILSPNDVYKLIVEGVEYKKQRELEINDIEEMIGGVFK